MHGTCSVHFPQFHYNTILFLYSTSQCWHFGFGVCPRKFWKIPPSDTQKYFWPQLIPYKLRVTPLSVMLNICIKLKNTSRRSRHYNWIGGSFYLLWCAVTFCFLRLFCLFKRFLARVHSGFPQVIERLAVRTYASPQKGQDISRAPSWCHCCPCVRFVGGTKVVTHSKGTTAVIQ